MSRQDIINQIFDNQGTMKRGMQNYFHAQAHKLPISRSQIELLFAIKHNQPVSGKHVAQSLNMTPGAVSQLLDVLLTQNLVVRTADAHDRRLQLLQVSKKGDKLIASIESHRQKIMEHVMNELETDELEVWLRVQQKIIAEVEKHHMTQKGTI